MGDKGKKDKGKREQQKKAQLTPKEKRKLKISDRKETGNILPEQQPEINSCPLHIP